MIQNLKSTWMPALPLRALPNSQLKPRPKLGRNNWSVRSQTQRRTTPTIWRYRFHSLAEMMLSTWELCIWVLQRVSQLMLFSTLVLNIWPSLVPSVTTKPQATSNSKNTTHFPAHSFSVTNLQRGAEPKHTTCTNLIPIKSCQRPLQS